MLLYLHKIRSNFNIMSTIKERIIKSVKEVLPGTTKTCIWLVKITVGVSLAIVFLKYLKILPWFSELISPAFNLIGLPGEAALPYVSGYFVNVYAAISVAVGFNFDVRTITILSVMILCSHNMITETAVQKKTGSSATRIVLMRTISAFILAYILNKILPANTSSTLGSTNIESTQLLEMLKEWAKATILVIIKMTVLIYSLGIMQRLLSEFGIIKWLSKFFRPFLHVFGLPAKTSFLWIVANTLGLAYGAAIMIEESSSGRLGKKDADLLNTHICISHSNLEDLMLLSSIGGIWHIILLSRWAASLFLVWELRLEYLIKERFMAPKKA